MQAKVRVRWAELLSLLLEQSAIAEGRLPHLGTIAWRMARRKWVRPRQEATAPT